MPPKGGKTCPWGGAGSSWGVFQVGQFSGGLNSSPLPWNHRRAWVERDSKVHLLLAGTPSTRAGCSLNASRHKADKSFSVLPS